ncbi:SGNH/GDSL hydrolase family protein [Parafilimonas terrae]|uniref:Lysophospholipase L1 n=1 Tax=Parafilimonas terrae TaxID=1465490 RepID=A0A1I5Z2D9_9BACT|nr:SGNH/GDSL hydrolase family protein [Parafilimonas terrae]SFQ50257.1 Lysophospholipase L1 [Parafilimonas terrae]
MCLKIYIIAVLQLALFWLITGCIKQSENPGNIAPRNNDTPMHDTSHTGNFSWLALGDSYTIGESVSAAERFPAQTIALLTGDTISFSDPEYIAVTGWTTQNLLDGIIQKNPQSSFDVVSLLIGVNDQYQHFDTAGYRTRFTACLEKAIELAGNKERVFVLSIPDYSVTPFAQQMDRAQISKEIDEFNMINKAVTLSYNISYTDITPLTREAENDNTLIALDGLHPSGKEYAKWAALLAPQIQKILQ